jgi:hypothetical protein
MHEERTIFIVNFGGTLSEQDVMAIHQLTMAVCERGLRVGAIDTPLEHISATFLSTLYAYAASEDYNPARIRELVSQMGIPDHGWATHSIFVMLPDDSVIAALLVLELYKRTRGTCFPMVLRRRRWIEMGLPRFALECIPLQRFYEGE